jgi:hypothetical protein
MEIARVELKSEAGFRLALILHAPETVSPLEAVCRLVQKSIKPDASVSEHETPVRGGDKLQALALALRLLVSEVEIAQKGHGELSMLDGSRFDPSLFGYPSPFDA